MLLLGTGDKTARILEAGPLPPSTVARPVISWRIIVNSGVASRG